MSIGDPLIRGPKRVPRNGQIVVPVDLLRDVGIAPGMDSVYVFGQSGSGRILLVRESEARPRLDEVLRGLMTTDPG